jgi:hypothetical protein
MAFPVLSVVSGFAGAQNSSESDYPGDAVIDAGFGVMRFLTVVYQTSTDVALAHVGPDAV